MQKVLLLIGMSVLACTARADMVSHSADGQSELRLMESPCTNAEILALIAPEWHGQFKAAQATFPAGTAQACWIDTASSGEPGYYYLVFTQGSVAFPITMFISAPGV